ncbi:MAG: Rpn family recombination-promoting nuclease/putative transposase [Cyanobacteria bacterium RI_101]|nr:Rpn family recombination-promoting nuclease/putative transposase [Cyanobacteria bacterium RI_101]
MFDNTCKFLAETFPADFARWLLGEPLPLTKLEPSELFLTPIRADSVIFLQSSRVILHLEFQTRPQKRIPFRMADYYLRLYRKFPRHQIRQFVIYLVPSASLLVRETLFATPHLSHVFEVIRLWEQEPDIFLNTPGLLPLAVLTRAEDPIDTLGAVVQELDKLPEPNLQSELTAASAVISGLVLEREVIQRLLRSELMKESVIYQEILQEGEERGLKKGEQKEKMAIARRMLQSGLNEALIAQVTGLSLAEIQALNS